MDNILYTDLETKSFFDRRRRQTTTGKTLSRGNTHTRAHTQNAIGIGDRRGQHSNAFFSLSLVLTFLPTTSFAHCTTMITRVAFRPFSLHPSAPIDFEIRNYTRLVLLFIIFSVPLLPRVSSTVGVVSTVCKHCSRLLSPPCRFIWRRPKRWIQIRVNAAAAAAAPHVTQYFDSIFSKSNKSPATFLRPLRR